MKPLSLDASARRPHVRDIGGDFLEMAHPAPWEHGLAERNLAGHLGQLPGLALDLLSPRWSLHEPHLVGHPHNHVPPSALPLAVSRF